MVHGCRTAVRFYAGEFSITKALTPKGKEFDLTNLPCGVSNREISKDNSMNLYEPNWHLKGYDKVFKSKYISLVSAFLSFVVK
jgi:hypothetical protein